MYTKMLERAINILIRVMFMEFDILVASAGQAEDTSYHIKYQVFKSLTNLYPISMT